MVRKAFRKSVEVDREFQRKTTALVQEHIGTPYVAGVTDLVKIDEHTIEQIKRMQCGENTKVINLIRSIEKLADENSGDPYLLAMADRARSVQETFENRQTATADALDQLLGELRQNEERKKEQAAKGFDGLTYFVYRTLLDAGITEAEMVSRKIKDAFVNFPNWQRSENEYRELRKKVTFAIVAEMDEVEEATAVVEELFNLLERAQRI